MTGSLISISCDPPLLLSKDGKSHIEELKQAVKQLLKETDKPLARLKLIDSIRRLGVAYHFEEEIRDVLSRFYVDGFESLRGLRETSLCFRLLREDRHCVSSGMTIQLIPFHSFIISFLN